jgi:hypothetical protein
MSKERWIEFWIAVAAGIFVTILFWPLQCGGPPQRGDKVGYAPTRGSGNVYLGEGNISDIAVTRKGNMVEIKFKNGLWLSSVSVSYDGAQAGMLKQLDTMVLVKPATPGRHRLELQAERGSHDAGRSWYREIVVE